MNKKKVTEYLLAKYGNFISAKKENCSLVQWAKYIAFGNELCVNDNFGDIEEYYCLVYKENESWAFRIEATVDPHTIVEVGDFLDTIDILNNLEKNESIKDRFLSKYPQGISILHLPDRLMRENWIRYIDFANSISNSTWIGNCTNMYYSINSEFNVNVEDEDICNSRSTKKINLGQFIKWLESLNKVEPNNKVMKEEEEEEMVVCYDGESYPEDECHQIHEDASYGGQWAHKAALVWCEYNDGWALNDDVQEVSPSGDYFINGAEPECVNYSSYEGMYLDTECESVYYGYVSSSNHREYFIDRYNDSSCIDDEYYRNGEVANSHGWEYDDDEGEYVKASEQCNAPYHRLDRKNKWNAESKYTIGFEIEKEDDDAIEIKYAALHKDTGWCKEDDSSLEDGGYELVSPAFDLFDSGLDEDIKDRRLIKLINGNQSSRCGGHINVGSTLFSTTELFEHLSGYFPLFYSMYEHRIETYYSKAKKKHEYFSRDKMSSIYIKSNVLEFRIPSAVKNVQNLLWRRDLMRILCKSIKLVPATKNTEAYYRGRTEVEVLQAMLNQNSLLYKHLRLVYTQEQVLSKAEKFVMYSESYNDKVLPKIIRGTKNPDGLEDSASLGA